MIGLSQALTFNLLPPMPNLKARRPSVTMLGKSADTLMRLLITDVEKHGVWDDRLEEAILHISVRIKAEVGYSDYIDDGVIRLKEHHRIREFR